MCQGFPGGASGKELTCQCWKHEMGAQSLGLEDLLEERMATQCSILAPRIPWTVEPGWLQSLWLYTTLCPELDTTKRLSLHYTTVYLAFPPQPHVHTSK